MKWRFMAAVMAVALLVLLVQDIPLSSYLRSVERDRMVTSLERDAFVLAGESARSLRSTDASGHAQVTDLAKRYRAAGGARVVIVDSAGTALVTSDDDPSSVGSSFSSRPEIAAALSGRIDTGQRYSTTLSEELLYVSVPVLDGTTVLGAVRLTYPAQVVDDRASARLGALLAAFLTSIAVAGIVGLIFSTTVTRRLTLLKETTELLASGRLDERADERSGASELRSLSRSFNVMADRLSASIDQQRNFSADASHQLRTPLTALRLKLEGARELLRRDPDGSEARLDAAERELDRLNDIIEGLLQLSRLEGSDQPPVTVDLARVARERIEQWAALAQESGIDLRYTGQEQAPVFVAPGAAEQLIDNLLDNAIAVLGRGDSIVVTVEAHGGRTSLHVFDSGPGMTEQERTHAFDRFWRGRSGTGGSGLGLAIVAQLALHSGGSARLDPSPLGGLDASVTLITAASGPTP
ncbi:MAG: ATP-binding protein [Actinomycetota bacterium]